LNMQEGYDGSATTYSPDGRLFQVEYAREAVKRGTTTVGLKFKDGAILIIDKRITSPLIEPSSIEKIFKIDDSIGVTVAGILSDARVLIERAQLKAQQHRVTYDSSSDVLTIVKDICALKQICTQSGGLRPFGVSLLVAGIDENGPVLFETDPTGIFFQYRARAIGEGENEIEEILYKEYKKDMSVDDGVRLAISALKKVLGDKFKMDRIDLAVVRDKDKKFRQLSFDEIKNIVDKG